MKIRIPSLTNQDFNGKVYEGFCFAAQLSGPTPNGLEFPKDSPTPSDSFGSTAPAPAHGTASDVVDWLTGLGLCWWIRVGLKLRVQYGSCRDQSTPCVVKKLCLKRPTCLGCFFQVIILICTIGKSQWFTPIWENMVYFVPSFLSKSKKFLVHNSILNLSFKVNVVCKNNM